MKKNKKYVNLMCGISGAGKSTFIKNFVVEDETASVLVSPDMQRKAISGDISNQKVSPQAFFNCFRQFETAMADNSVRTIFWDATNLGVKSLNDIINIIDKYDGDDDVVTTIYCLEDSRNWKLCFDRVEADINNGVDRSKSNVVNEETGIPIIQSMSERYIDFVDNVLPGWCRQNNVKLVSVDGNYLDTKSYYNI